MSEDICGYEDTSSGEPCEWSPGDSCPFHNVDDPPDNGRPTKLTKEREEKIAQAIEDGKSMRSAARMAGVHPNTIFAWLDRGEGQDEGIYADFHDRIERARGHGEDYYHSLAMELAIENGDHRFIASLMKQRYPESWGETETGVDGVTIEVGSEVVEIEADADAPH